jgi:hypothetical protein
LEYKFGQYSLIFEPMGRNIIGAWGRVDVYVSGFKSDKYMLILIGDSFNDADWFFSSFQDKRIKMAFNKDNIEKIIENWIDKVSV